MLGTIVNTCTILTGSFVGSFLSRGISEKYKTALFDALGLATVGLGANAVVHNLPNTRIPGAFYCKPCHWHPLSARGLIFAGVLTRCLRTARAAESWRKGFLRRYFCSVSAHFPF